MSADAPVPSQPLRPDELRDHLAHCRPRPRGSSRWVILALLGLAAGVMIASGGSLPGLVLPWLIVPDFVGWAAFQKRAVSAAHGRVSRLQELTTLGRHDEAIGDAWRLLPALRGWPELHVHAVWLLGANLASRSAYESALVAYDYLLDLLSEGEGLGELIRLQRVNLLLHDDRLADADDELRVLSARQRDPMGRALLRIGRLHQQLKTGHFEDADALDDRLIDQLQPLGMEAGFGYGLAAGIYHSHERQADAERWYRRATLLIEPDRLVDRFPQLEGLRGLPAAPSLADARMADAPEADARD